ncbi:MAG TPA: folylpolyglutamate synthase/dihydrofolate synthase family protein [Rhodopila sp.]|uniref:bifunctional folylpolyglutamate synthase/dihydrofolate synthase n=1 Tax=Rhodopila sp. TaxID=2480087 RepID=UPI002CC962F1|nr:folylpolyglutamate synthase/dihydrofolate synthase family protein [Rhodopila sp.]HVY16763.1 folylpolyglutamate synthase/dihydrofolate synthase family protein [Rhodopila sp.]
MNTAWAIEAINDRLMRLHPRLIDLSLDRLRDLLGKLGHPERHLPPVVHVAGTNGKGSTCAFIRAMSEAAGRTVHVYTSPHLVRFNERIRIAGTLVDDETLIATMERIERINDNAPITVFEVITAAAFDLFARTPADLCVLEVGLGGRGDATNVIDRPAVCAITAISLDHRELLGPTVEVIAGEKAGIMKPGVPVVIGAQPDPVRQVLLEHAASVGAPALLRGRDWDIADTGSGLRFHDAAGAVDTPYPALLGAFQHDNAGIALAALRAVHLRHQPSGLSHAEWPARMQRLTGRLAATLPQGWSLWLDGGHNPGGGVALAEHLRGWSDQPIHLVVGMKQAKDTAEFLHPLLPLAATVWAVREPEQHQALPIEAIIAASGGVARAGGTVREALGKLRAEWNAPSGYATPVPGELSPSAGPARVLICGSLYLAGEVLKLDQA